MPLKFFLDTPILREGFIAHSKGKNWKKELGFPDKSTFATSYKCLGEMYGILKTNLLENDLSHYNCKSSLSIRDILFQGDEFLNIYWHRQTLENLPENVQSDDEHGKILNQLIKWKKCYQSIKNDFDQFLKTQNINEIHVGTLFSNHEWQSKFYNLAEDTLIPSEDLEIVLSAWYAKSDIFVTCDHDLIRFSFSLPLEPGIPLFCKLQNLDSKFHEVNQGIKKFPESNNQL